MILSAVESCGQKQLRMAAGSEKKHFGGTKILKKLSEQRKMLLRPCCKKDHYQFAIPVFRGEKSRSLDSRNVQKSLLRGIWLSVGFRLFIGKTFWQTIRREKSSITTLIRNTAGNIFMDEK